MNDRDLKLFVNDLTGLRFAEFNKYTNGNLKRVKYLITAKEYEYASALINNNDIYVIDNFCYSIS